MNLLITGGCGYIGSHTAKEFLKQGAKITIIDNLCKGKIEVIDTLKKIGEVEFINEDLSNYDKIKEIFKSHKFDAVVHFAAFIEVFESTQKPIKYYLNNTANAINLIKLCNDFGVNNFIFSSTAATYGEPEENIVLETTKQNPINPYGRSKLMVEWILKDNAIANKNFKFVILRYFNVAGADVDGDLGQNYPNATHLIKIATQTILKKRDKMAIFGDDYPTKDGTCLRDYIHVCDLANAHLKALQYLQNGGESEIFNVGYGKGFSVKEVIKSAKEVSGVDFKVEIEKRREGDPASLVSNNEKICKIIGWKPKYNDINLIIKTALNWEKKIK